MLLGQDVRVLNYVVVGEVRSGSRVVQSTLNNRPGHVAVCHGDLFHPDEKVRRASHEEYFGPSRWPRHLPEWFQEGVTSPWQYINHVILDRPLRGERAVGFRVLYPDVRRLELWELFESRYREGDFCLVVVLRNPVACLVSLKQAERSGVWTRGWDAAPAACPAPVHLDADEVTEFCRCHAATLGKVRASCADRLEVQYRDLLRDYQREMQRVFDFLELPSCADRAVPGCRRLRNRNRVRERIANLDSLLRCVPSDVRDCLLADDLV